MLLVTLLCAAGFAAVHLLVPRMRFLSVVPRSRWLSGAGGVAVAYVFLHILPDLAAHQRGLAEGEGAPLGERLVYLLALAGLVAFYGLERAARTSKGRSGREAVEAHVFWLHLASFGLYNLLVGYLLLHRQEEGAWSLVLYFTAIGLHFVTTDFGLHSDHPQLYDRRGRWLLCGAVLLGWGLGLGVEVPEGSVSLLFALLAGAIVLNVLKEELPEERQSRFLPFLLGAAGYAALLLAI